MQRKDAASKRLAADWSQVFPPLPREDEIPRAKSRDGLSNNANPPESESFCAASAGVELPKLKGLSIRQPWAEQIMRGKKTLEYRQRPVHYRGTIYVYASLGRYPKEEEEEFDAEVGFTIAELPRGVVVGTIDIVDSIDEGSGDFAWHLANPKRLDQPIPPRERPQPIWFHPFGNP